MIDQHRQFHEIDRGQPVDEIQGNPFDCIDLPYRHFGLVSVRPVMTNNVDFATEIQRDADHAKPESLQYVAEQLFELSAPYFLQFYKLAWFAERVDTATEASERIEFLHRMHNLTLMKKYINAPRDPGSVPKSVAEGMKYPRQVGRQLVLSDNNPEQNFPITDVGARSSMGKMMGLDWIQRKQFVLDHRLDQIDASIHTRYSEVADRGVTLFDECLALIPAHGKKQAYWLRYHRVLFPTKTATSVIIASWCMQGETRSDLIAPFGKPGYEVPADA